MATTSIFKVILSSFEELPLKPLLENEIYNLLQKQIPEDYGISTEERAELIAFSFLEPGNNKIRSPNFYFVPYSVRKNNDVTENEFSSYSMVTLETVNYWLGRLKHTNHPVLAARYAGLIYDMSSQVTGSKSSFNISERYVESLLDLVNKKLYKVPVYAISKVGRALEIALLLNNSLLIDQCKTTILNLEKEIAISDKPGSWGFSFDLLVGTKTKILSKEEELAIIEKLEERFSGTLRTDSWCAESAAKRLMKYYHNLKNPQEIKRVITSLETSYSLSTDGLSAIQQAHHLEQLYEFCKRFKLNEDANKYLQKLREVSKETEKDMKSISVKVDIPKEKIDFCVDQILKGDNIEDIFVRIIETFTPRLTQVKEELERLQKNAPLQFLISRDLIDKKGRRVAKIQPILEEPDSHLVLQYSDSIRLGSILLNFLFEEAINRDILTLHEMMKFLGKSCVIEKSRLPIVQKGLEAYLNGEYVVGIHLLIPQFEEAIRNLVELNGGNVITPKGNAFNLKTFDHLLHDQIVTDVFGENKSLYFRALFTDKCGWNIRNKVAHGMMDTAEFLNKQNIDRVLHAILCLGMIRLNDN